MAKKDRTAHILAEVGRLLDQQAELMQHHVKDLTEDQLREYEQRRNRIRQLCLDLKDLNSYDEV
jgi:hypothetical protein